MLLAIGTLTLAACNDDEDYAISNTPLMNAGAVQTGNAEITSVSAQLNATIDGLQNQSSSAYTTGFYYAEGDADPKQGTRVLASLTNGNLTADVSGLQTGVTYSYCAFATLQGRVNYYGDVKKFTTVEANLITAEAGGVTGAKATMGATLTGTIPTDLAPTCGVKVATTSDAAEIKLHGRDYPNGTLSMGFEQQVTGLLPNTTYYYVPYVNLGSGYLYGEVKSFTTANVAYEYVDLGLSQMWATFNVGAENVTEAGGSFTYAEATTVAAQIGAGHTPSLSDIKELINTCSYSFGQKDGVLGATFTAPNGNQIFFPAASYWSADQASASTHAQSMSLNAASANLSAELVEQLFVVRPVRKSANKLNVENLINTWYLDLNEAGVSFRFDGPLYYYGTADNWNTCADGEPGSGDSWNWCPVWKDNTWICSAQNFGTMTFSADGTFMVNDLGNNQQISNGKWTIDETNKTLTLEGANILHLPGFHDIVTNWSKELKVMNLTADKLQIAALRDNSSEGQCLLVHNFVPESVANSLALIRPLLNKTWRVDLDANATSYVSDGPVYFYGPVEGYSWTQVHDTLPATAEGAWSWIPTWKDNQWICAAQEYGTMTFTEDGKVTVVDLVNGTEKSGTYTVDITNHTLSLEGVEVLYVDKNVANLTTDLKLLDLSENHLMIGLDRGDNTLLGVNYVSEAYWKSFQPGNYTVNFMTCDTNWNWQDHKQSLSLEAGKSYTVTAASAQTNGMIDCIDIEGLSAEHPNAILRIDEVKVDGKAIAYDANLMGHGDIEGKGNYRIELFNTYGKTGELSRDAFGAGITEAGGNKAAVALACTEKIEVTFTVITLDGFTAGLTVCDSNWNSTWPDASVALSLNSTLPKEFTIKYEGARTDGMIELIEVQNILTQLPNLQLTLKAVVVDGANVDFDASKILYGDLEGKGNYRVELYNTYGGSKGNAAFAGEADGKIPGLGFQQSIAVTFTLDKLF